MMSLVVPPCPTSEHGASDRFRCLLPDLVVELALFARGQGPSQLVCHEDSPLLRYRSSEGRSFPFGDQLLPAVELG